jgi:hypothetical protein
MTPLPLLTTEGSALAPLVLAAGFFLASLALGVRLLKLLGADSAGARVERAVIAVCLGAGVLQFVPFALGMAGQFNPTALRIAALVVAVLVLPDLRAVVRSALAARSTRQRPDAWLVAWIIALLPAIFMACLIALAPSYDDDGVAYHLTVPKRWMGTGHLEYLPTYPYSNAPMGMDLLFGWAMALAGDSAAKCVHLVLGLSAVAAIYLAGKRLGGAIVGVVPATLFLVGPGGLSGILGFSYVEGGAALATATALLSWLVWLQTDTRGSLRVAALLAGVAVSFKIGAVFFPVALAALSLWAMYERLRESNHPRAFAGALLATLPLVPFVAAPVLPWFARAWALTGNPFYPMLAGLIPSRDLSPALATMVDQYNRYMLWGNSLGPGWGLEQRANLVLAVSLVLLAAGVFACFRLRNRLARGAAVIVTITVIAQLFAAGLYLRYWLPVSATIMLAVMAGFGTWFARRWMMVAWVAITLALSLLQTRHHFSGGAPRVPDMVSTLSGAEDRRAFLEKYQLLFGLYERANHDVPANGGILLSGFCSGFYIDRTTYCAEFVQESLRFASWEEFTADIQRLGITHVIAQNSLAVAGPLPKLGTTGGVSAITQAGQYRQVSQLLREHSRVLQTALDQGLYEIDPAWLAGLATNAAP